MRPHRDRFGTGAYGTYAGSRGKESGVHGPEEGSKCAIPRVNTIRFFELSFFNPGREASSPSILVNYNIQCNPPSAPSLEGYSILAKHALPHRKSYTSPLLTKTYTKASPQQPLPPSSAPPPLRRLLSASSPPRRPGAPRRCASSICAPGAAGSGTARSRRSRPGRRRQRPSWPT